MLLALLMTDLLLYVVVHACGADILLTNGLSFVNACTPAPAPGLLCLLVRATRVPADGYCRYCCVQGSLD